MLVSRPRTFDFAALADAVKRNNMGLGGFRVRTRVQISGGQVSIEKTKQTFTLVGGSPIGIGEYATLEILDWKEADPPTARIVPPTDPKVDA